MNFDYFVFYWIDNSSIGRSMYTSVLNASSPTYTRTVCGMSNYYFEAIQINVNQTGQYTLFSKSNMDTYGYIYKYNFSPTHPSKNKYSGNDDGCRDGQFNSFAQFQFNFVTHLLSNTTYILVMTTYSSNTTGPFSIIAYGLDKVSFKRYSEYISIVFLIITRKYEIEKMFENSVSIVNRQTTLTFD